MDARFDVLADRSSAAGAPREHPHWPLLATDLNDDGVADYVDPHGVLLAEATSPFELRASYTPPYAEPWTAAIEGDVDGDHRRDIVAFREGEKLLDVLQCSRGDGTCWDEGGLFRLAPIPTTRGVFHASFGHLRGLPAMDIAIVERGDEASGEGDVVSVLHGQQNGQPANPVEQAQVRRVEHLDIDSIFRLGGDEPDAFDDVLLTLGEPGAAREYAFLHGTAGWHLTAPYQLPPGPLSPATRSVGGTSALLGDFSGQGAPWNDLVFLGTSSGNGDPYAYGVMGADDAALPPSPDGVLLRELLGSAFLEGCARVAAGDVDGEGRDEVVIVHGRAICAPAPTTELIIGRWGDDGELELEPSTLDAGAIVGGAELEVADVDGDGAADLLLAGSGVLLRYPGSPSGLSPTPRRVSLPSPEPVSGVVALARSAGSRGAGRLAVLTTTTLVLVDEDGATKASAPGGRALHSVDLDADGLGDLLVQRDDGLHALRTLRASPLGGE